MLVVKRMLRTMKDNKYNYGGSKSLFLDRGHQGKQSVEKGESLCQKARNGNFKGGGKLFY